MLKRNLQLLSLTALATLTAKAQTSWPTKPIRLIVPHPAGGVIDNIRAWLKGAGDGSPFVKKLNKFA